MSNKELGDSFRDRIQRYLRTFGHELVKEYSLPVGLGKKKKQHAFDLGNDHVLVECKHYNWTSAGKQPSAKISTLLEAMLYFVSVADGGRSKMLFMPKTTKKGVRTGETLAEHFIRLNGWAIPSDVEIWEFDEETSSAERKA